MSARLRIRKQAVPYYGLIETGDCFLICQTNNQSEFTERWNPRMTVIERLPFLTSNKEQVRVQAMRQLERYR